jgi:lysine-ketoglutarate reductase/saccharopine dehydrogenase-like protein (TIGR00300 family)
MPDEIVELSGHLIDSFTLSKVLDTILKHKACYEIQKIKVGISVKDTSFARILVAHKDPNRLKIILREIARYGAEPVVLNEVNLRSAPMQGVFPDDFYTTTNLDTAIYLGSHWITVKNPEMDSGIRVDRSLKRAETIKMAQVKRGDLIVVGHNGVRVTPLAQRHGAEGFEFMTSEVSAEKPKRVLIAEVARRMQAESAAKRPTLFVGGPAIVHTGAAPLLVKLIQAGYVQILLAGNALAAHDIECSLFGTSLGVSMCKGTDSGSGHENHLRAINIIRRAGGIRHAVHKGILKSGIMHACVKQKVDWVLTGSIRDDGPLPEVITDMLRAQAEMRRRCRRVKLAVMLATLLHSVATGNMLPASTRVINVDIDPSSVTKLYDRGSLQTIGIVTDVQPFLSELLIELGIR